MNLPKNPTPNSNYLINENIMFGWYPGSDNNGSLNNNIHKLIDTGRNVFVNLTTLFNYINVVSTKVENTILIHYPIDDCGLATFSELAH